MKYSYATAPFDAAAAADDDDMLKVSSKTATSQVKMVTSHLMIRRTLRKQYITLTQLYCLHKSVMYQATLVTQ